MKKLVKKGLSINLVGVERRKYLTPEEIKVIKLIYSISRKGVEKTESAHNKLLNLGEKISRKAQWKDIIGKEVKEFLKFRE